MRRSIAGGLALGLAVFMAQQIGIPGTQPAEPVTLPEGVVLEPALPFAFIDIDDTTYDRWDEPLVTPRDKLKQLVEFAVEGQAKIIIVDIELSRGTGPGDLLRGLGTSDGAILPATSAADAELASYLENYGQGEAAIEPAPLVLVRGFSLGQKEAESIAYLSPREAFPELETVVRENPHIYWASPLFERDESSEVRRWRLWEVTCRDGQVDVLPSVQLLASALLRGNWPQVQGKLKEQKPRDCSLPLEEDPSIVVDSQGGGLHLFQDPLGSHILYSISWHRGETPPFQNAARAQGVPVRGLDVLPAHYITENETPPALDRVKDRVVIIGASHQASRDFHATPLGIMPGAIVIANAINTMLQVGELKYPSRLQTLTVSLILVALVSAYFHFLGPLLAGFASAGTISAAAFGIGWYWVPSGIWLDTTIPSVVVTCYLWPVRLRPVWQQGGLGWRAVLYPRHRNAAEQQTRAPGGDPPASQDAGGRAERSTSLSSGLILVLLASFAAPALADATAAGYVDWLDGMSNEYEIRRAEGDPVSPVPLWTVVRSGDRVIVRRPDRQYIRIQLYSGELVTIGQGGRPSPYLVPETAVGVPSPIGHLISEIGRKLQFWKDEAGYGPTFTTVPAMAAARGEDDRPLDVALLDHPLLKVIEGERAFTLTWSGGMPPFEVGLLRDEGHVLRLDSLEARQLPPQRIELAEGTYRVSIRDAAGQQVSAQFEVVARSELPEPPTELGTLPDEARTTIHATWLAGSGDGVWALEGYLQVADLAERYEPAGVLADLLAAGDIPPL